MENREVRLAYLAGALDGDGSFSLIKATAAAARSPLYYPMIQLANVKKELIELFMQEFGGSYTTRKSYIGKDGGTRQECYQWKREKSDHCFPVLENIIPYLIIKKERAMFLRDYIINNPFVRGSNVLDGSILMSREKAHIKMRSFNDKPHTNCELLSISKRNSSDSDTFWSYIAGIMDTDGSFSLKRENRKSGGSISPVFTAQISLSMTDCRSIYYLMNNFIGGNLMLVEAKTATNGFCYRFSITSRKNAIVFLKKCIPFLRLKKEVAIKLLEFCETFQDASGNRKLTDSVIEQRNSYYSYITQLNKYGVYKSPLMDLKPLPDNAGGNKAEAAQAGTVNAVSEETIVKMDAVL
jgi:hypothetical protein